MRQLSGLDAAFMYLETPSTPQHIASLNIYDPSTVPGKGKIRFKEILRHIEERLGEARSFRQRAVTVPFDLDHPYWIEDPDFDLEYHVRHVALPKPGDWRQLCILAARIHSRQMDLTRPQWELTVIEGLDEIEGLPKGSFATLIKMHHAAVDGVSGVEIITALHDTSPETPAPEPKPWQPDKVPTPAELLARANVNNLLSPSRFGKAVARNVPGLGRVAKQFADGDLRMPKTGLRRAPPTRFNDVVTAHRVIEGREFPVSEFRPIRAAVPGATVNDAVLTVIGGALRQYLDAKGEAPGATLVAMAPISIRPEDRQQDAGNLITGMLLGLGTHIADPLERLRYVHAEAVNSKALTHALGARALTEFSQFIPGALAGLAARLATQYEITDQGRSINTIVTNVPGPPVPLYFAGARMVKGLGLGPLFQGMGLVHPISSYCGKVIIGVTCTREMMPDPEFYMACIVESFEALKAAAGPEA
jgi:WS/DGAT/MGAT family acyltransferase